MKKRSGFQIMMRLIGLVKPLAGYMILAIVMGLIGHLCAAFITVFGGYAVANIVGADKSLPLTVISVSVIIFALLRGFLRYAEQACNHYIAFKLLALIRDRVFAAAVLYQRNFVDFSGVLIPSIALMSSFGPCVALAALGSTLQNTFAAGNRVLDILDESPVVEEVTGREEVKFSGAQAEHVIFAYGNETILDDVSLDIPKGKVIGIVGKSGSGKSTLLKLLMRFWNVQSGSMKISDTSMNDIIPPICGIWKAS